MTMAPHSHGGVSGGPKCSAASCPSAPVTAGEGAGWCHCLHYDLLSVTWWMRGRIQASSAFSILLVKSSKLSLEEVLPWSVWLSLGSLGHGDWLRSRCMDGPAEEISRSPWTLAGPQGEGVVFMPAGPERRACNLVLPEASSRSPRRQMAGWTQSGGKEKLCL